MPIRSSEQALPSVSSLREASELLATAAAARRRLRIGEDVTLDGMRAVLEHEAGDLTCVVEAGIRVSELQAALAPHGQRLALDPPGDPTIGALVATNAAGPLRHRYGSPRDLVLGATLVLGDGTVCNAGGKVVKNVAGYDLGKLVCGSRGRLALIARVALRLHPAPAKATTVVTDTDDTATATASVLASQLQPSALDVLHPGRVALLFEGSPRAVDAQVEAARQLIGATPVDDEPWREARRRQAAALGVVRFSPSDLRNTLSVLTEAVVRPAVGVAHVPQRTSDVPATGLRRVQAALQTALDPVGTLA